MKQSFDDSGWDFAKENREFGGTISAWRGSPIMNGKAGWVIFSYLRKPQII